MNTKTLMAIALPMMLSLLWSCSTDTPSRSVRAEGQYRYAAKPQGHDGPASRCVVCHSLEKDGPLRVAPTLWGIVRADKGRFEWYGYSTALAQAEGQWTEQELDDYLADPDKFLPGTKKTLIGIADANERGEIIEFLQTLRD